MASQRRPIVRVAGSAAGYGTDGLADISRTWMPDRGVVWRNFTCLSPNAETTAAAGGSLLAKVDLLSESSVLSGELKNRCLSLSDDLLILQ